jgi:hypothetical protein
VAEEERVLRRLHRVHAFRAQRPPAVARSGGVGGRVRRQLLDDDHGLTGPEVIVEERVRLACEGLRRRE